MQRPLLFLAVPITLASLLVSSGAFAQSEDGFDKDAEDTLESKKQTKEEAATGDKMPGEKDGTDENANKPEEEIWKTYEDPLKVHRYIGLRFRDAYIPKAILNIFADGGTNVNVPMGGIEFGTRRDNLEFIFSLSYASYVTSDMLFKGKNEPDEAYELVRSDLSLIYGKIEILYNIPLDTKSRFTVQVGGGVGIAGVLGKLYRVQAYPNVQNASGDDPSQWSKCGGPGAGYCANDNDHFSVGGKDYDEPTWANGGSLPFIFPWIAIPQVSFRWKPIKYFQARADVGFAITSGIYFGLGAGYILP